MFEIESVKEIIIRFNIEFPDIVEREMGHVTGGGVASDSLPLTTLTLVVIDP